MAISFNQLRQAYPIISSNKHALVTSFWVGCFVFVFLFVFQPFELDAIAQHKVIIIAGYGVITFLTTSTFLLIQRWLFSEIGWTTWKQVIFYVLLINTIACLNFVYTKAYNPSLGLEVYRFVFFTLSIGILPITFFSITKQIQLDRKYVGHSLTINKKITATISSTDQSSQLQIKPTNQPTKNLDQENILFIESQGNYLCLHQMENGKITSHKTRGTITKILPKLDQKYFFKTHRAFIVNTRQIENVTGNAQGLKLIIKGTDQEVPVARNFVRDFKTRMTS